MCIECNHNHHHHEEEIFEHWCACGCEENDSEIPLNSLVKIDEVAPFFDLPTYFPKEDKIENLNLFDLEWEWSVLFFYPADFSPICSNELLDLKAKAEEIEKYGINFIVASTDTVHTHRAWINHEESMKNFSFPMMSDRNWDVSELFNILNDDTMMASRWTFIIWPDLVVKSIEVNPKTLGRKISDIIEKVERLKNPETCNLK